MYMFLKNIALYGVNNFLHVLNSSIETRNHLHQLVKNGIKDKIVNLLYEETQNTIPTTIK